jgi:hypothetical protein
MEKFEKAGFEMQGVYLMYKGEFIARFKYGKKEVGAWKAFLIKHFAVEEYLAAVKAKKAPLQILMAKGYIPAHIKKEIEKAGLSVKEEGYKFFKIAFPN